MQNVYEYEPEYFLESILILGNIYEEKTISKLKYDLMELYDGRITLAELEPLFEDVSALYDKVSDEVKGYINDDRASLLLKCREGFFSFAFIFYLYKRKSIMNAEAQIAAISEYILDNYGNSDEVLNVNTADDLFSFIHKFQCDKETKYDLLNVYFDFNELYTYIENMARMVGSILRDAMPLYSKVISDLMEYISSEMEAKGLAILSNTQNIKLEVGDGFNIYPMFALPHNVVIYVSDDMNTRLALVGVNVFTLNDYIDNSCKECGKAEEFLKIISDKTKLTILRILRNKSYYGSQIAEILNLTGATISKHMGTLLHTGVVTAIMKGNRVYYELNQEKAAVLLEDLSEIF